MTNNVVHLTETINSNVAYDPENDSEYMGPRMLAYFRERLVDMQQEQKSLIKEVNDRLKSQHKAATHNEVIDISGDPVTLTNGQTRQRDRLSKIEIAIDQIDNNKGYGFSEESDEAIGVTRLMASPIAARTYAEQLEYEIKQRALVESKPQPRS